MAQTQAERARNYRKRKREERAAAIGLGGGGVTPEKVTAVDKRDRARADRVKRAGEILRQAVPPRADLLDEALRTLRSVALDAGAGESSRVAAGRELLGWASGDSEGSGRGAPGSQSVPSPTSSSANGGGDGDGSRAPKLDDLFQ